MNYRIMPKSSDCVCGHDSGLHADDNLAEARWEDDGGAVQA